MNTTPAFRCMQRFIPFWGPCLSGVLRDWVALMLKWPAVKNSLGDVALCKQICRHCIMKWRSAFLGVGAVSNLLALNLLQEAIGSLPKQRLGFYLMENQPWERALVYLWMAVGHGHLVGVAHSTVRYWDLRYFDDPRLFVRRSGACQPMPDRVAVNGSVAFDACSMAGYPDEMLCDVEALRYLYLKRFCERNAMPPKLDTGLFLLVLGEFMSSATQNQMSLLNDAYADLPDGIRIVVKPHPACPISEDDYPAMDFEVTHESIEALLPTADVAYTGIVSSSAVDAYCAGVPVVSALDPDSLNLGPLRGMGNVRYVSSASELASAVVETSVITGSEENATKFFNLDEHLPCWRALIENS